MPHSIRIQDLKIHFSSTHFLVEHSKCSRLHGHNYHVNLEVEGDLNENFFVIDFFEIKKDLMKIVDELDHRLILPDESKDMKIIEEGTQINVTMSGKQYSFPITDVILLPIAATTAELLAKYIHDQLKPTYIDYKLTVEVAETLGSIAKYWE